MRVIASPNGRAQRAAGVSRCHHGEVNPACPRARSGRHRRTGGPDAGVPVVGAGPVGPTGTCRRATAGAPCTTVPRASTTACRRRDRGHVLLYGDEEGSTNRVHGQGVDARVSGFPHRGRRTAHPSTEHCCRCTATAAASSPASTGCGTGRLLCCARTDDAATRSDGRVLPDTFGAVRMALSLPTAGSAP